MDDDNSQAEGTSSSTEGAVGFSYPRATLESSQRYPATGAGASAHDSAAHPHYENIYESIDLYNAATVAAAPAAAAAAPIEINVAGPSSGISRSFPHAAQQHAAAPAAATNKRHDQYDRTAGYDVPRQMFRNACAGAPNNYGQRATSASAPPSSTSTRRANLHLDLNPNRARYTTASRPHRQRSFDDTESAHFNNFRYENIYEQIHEEPIYRNLSTSAPGGNANRVYGRLGVIGHGIGRIERHLSSSCGNIDHYNLGGHYAVLGHSHLGTVGHIRLNAAAASGAINAKPGAKEPANGGKSLNLFSCLSRENSQSMTNIHRTVTGTNNPGTSNISNAADASGSVNQSNTSSASAMRHLTGAIPKTQKPTKQKSNAPKDHAAKSEQHESSLNRMSKSSLQWMLINKWLPMWIGQEPDYNVLDFNFMFSRNCGGCGDLHTTRQQSLVRFDGHAEMSARVENDMARRAFVAANHSTTASGSSASLRPMRLNPSWSRLRECEHGSLSRPQPRASSPYDRYRDDYYDQRSAAAAAAARKHAESTRREADPFRNWELNTENNSFRPAGSAPQSIRRITDGTFPASGLIRQSSATESRNNVARSDAPNMERLVTNHRDVVEPVDDTDADDGSPTHGVDSRRYSDNTEDDQHDEDEAAGEEEEADSNAEAVAANGEM